LEDHPKRILVVDDDHVLRGVEADILGSAGYAVEQAENGDVAVEKLKARTPDLVLLDLLMPVLDGWGVLEHIQACDPRPRVVLVSGVREIVPPGHLAQCITGYVFKPFRVPQFLQVCADVLAVPAVIEGGGRRQASRRTFISEATVIGANGTPLAQGRVVQISPGGFRLELGVAIDPGSPVTIAFQVPGRAEPLEITGLVRWREAQLIGAEVTSLSGSDQAVLQALLDLG
jgi:CheY-like chemotaxis protein